MKFTVAIVALAASVMAAPSPWGEPPKPAPPAPGNCNNDHPTQVCCNGLGLGCNVLSGILGDSCSGESYCCQTNQVGLVNIALLNCVKL